MFCEWDHPDRYLAVRVAFFRVEKPQGANVAHHPHGDGLVPESTEAKQRRRGPPPRKAFQRESGDRIYIVCVVGVAEHLAQSPGSRVRPDEGSYTNGTVLTLPVHRRSWTHDQISPMTPFRQLRGAHHLIFRMVLRQRIGMSANAHKKHIPVDVGELPAPEADCLGCSTPEGSTSAVYAFEDSVAEFCRPVAGVSDDSTTEDDACSGEMRDISPWIVSVSSRDMVVEEASLSTASSLESGVYIKIRYVYDEGGK